MGPEMRQPETTHNLIRTIIPTEHFLFCNRDAAKGNLKFCPRVTILQYSFFTFGQDL